MASVFLQFVPPEREGFTKLHIYEATSANGSFVEIEEVTEIGSFPDYISEYSSDEAVSATDWFKIQWEDAKGALSQMSTAIQGGTSTVVGKIVSRVQARDNNLDVAIVTQEAEAAVQMYYGDDVDPYDVTLNPSYRILSGLTYLTMARSYSFVRTTQGRSVSIGLVSLRDSSTAQTDVSTLFDLADKELRMNVSRVMQMRTPRRSHLYQVVTEA